MLSLWEIVIVVGLILTLFLVVVVLVAYFAGDGPADPPGRVAAPPGSVVAPPTQVAKQVATTPPIVIRTTVVDRRKIYLRHDDTKGNGWREPLFQPPTNGSFIEAREVKEDLDLYCKLTGRIVRDCSCADCRELKASIGN